MRDLTSLEFHPTIEKLTKALCVMVQNDNPEFFRVLANFHLCKLASMMWVNVVTETHGPIPVNLYALNLASSGQGKGKATNIIEDQVLNQFMDAFSMTSLTISEEKITELALERTIAQGLDEDDVETIESALIKEYRNLGPILSTFDSATPEGIKDMRHKLLMGQIGSLNMEIDEIAKNFGKTEDVFAPLLEMYDVGKIKSKLTKNTHDNKRKEEIKKRCPVNFLMFGCPDMLLDASKNEDKLKNELTNGYARRCIYGYSVKPVKNLDQTGKERFKVMTDPKISGLFKKLSVDLAKLASISYYGRQIIMPKDVTVELLDYQIYCEKLADETLKRHEVLAKPELEHRYFRAMKIAGAYAFIDGEAEVSMDNLYHAIAMVERSGEAYQNIINSDPDFIKLAKYVAEADKPVARVNLMKDLPFYKGKSKIDREEMLNHAIEWGHQNHIVIKKTTKRSLDFIIGKTLQKTDLSKMILSYSKHIADGYTNANPAFKDLHKLMTKKGLHWCCHRIINGHRSTDNMLPGFNMLVLDVDGGITVQNVRTLLKGYKYMLYTTKRHTSKDHRFRLILPMNYHVELDPEEFKEFMRNVYEWIPFDVDEGACEMARKWLTHPGHHYYSKGDQLIDARMFIPHTAKNEDRQEAIKSMESLNNLERWFIQQSPGRGRNNQLLKYALVLVDMGYADDQIELKVLDLNKKLKTSLKEDEIKNTIMRTAIKAVIKRDS